MRATLMIVASWLIPILGVSAPVQATSRFPDPGIRGIKTICLMVVATDLLPAGNTDHKIEAAAIARLQQSHVLVLSAEDCPNDPNQPWLFLWLKARKAAAQELYAYEVVIDVRQAVKLNRDPKIDLEPVPTWQRWELGTADTDKLAATMQSSTMKLIDLFSTMYKDARARK